MYQVKQSEFIIWKRQPVCKQVIIVNLRTNTYTSHRMLHSCHRESFISFVTYFLAGKLICSNNKRVNYIMPNIYRHQSKKVLCQKIQQLNISPDPIATQGKLISDINEFFYLIFLRTITWLDLLINNLHFFGDWTKTTSRMHLTHMILWLILTNS